MSVYSLSYRSSAAPVFEDVYEEMWQINLLLRLPVEYGGVLNSPRFWGFFSVSKVGLLLMGDTAVQYTDCYLSPCQHDFLNSISTGICRQNTQFNMYSTTSKHQEDCTFRDSHAKCLITTNFDKFHREAVAKGDESR